MKKIINFFSDRKTTIKKIFITLIVVFIYLFGTYLYIPFLPKEIYTYLKNESPDESLNLFLPSSFCILSLGVAPYITASIIMQLAQKVIPLLKDWREQGSKGNYKINLTTKFLTLFTAIFQGLALIFQFTRKIKFHNDIFQKLGLKPKPELTLNYYQIIIIISILVVGSFVCIWLANIITSKGISDGISFLIVVSVSKELSKNVKSLVSEGLLKKDLFNGGGVYLLILLLFFILLFLTVVLSSSYLKIPVYYMSTENNDKALNHIPIKLNSAGVLPIILANAILNVVFTLRFILSPANKFQKFFSIFEESRSEYLGLGFFIYLLLIMLFAFFSIFMNINANEIAQSLSKKNAYLEGKKPGKETVDKINYELFKITVIGVIFLTLLSAVPDLINIFFKKQLKQIGIKSSIGGTALLIVVGVAIECMKNLTKKTNIQKMHNTLF
ncbi:preprotein translocase subunit SecY [Candidatus Phytoplasma pini]|uniref:Protein translocase subunit SecY n=1 Tax=Candidatus Phytoplasma pini TaxID=267362 RepID=A0A559KJP6_9MOLU|nr:preprotein translocase subunit SecY [Candidatus Phytoplasma pini]TVY12339.1 preprotein translocase subunit SecY [Candidatus Phytoplasma pini]